MTGTTTAPSGCVTIELELPIEAPREKVWTAIFEDANSWWHPGFRLMGEDSQVSFDPVPGGKGLIETGEDGAGLLWFTVQMYLPADYKIYVTGHIASDFGGPMTSILKIEVSETESGCVFKLTDARHGHVDESQAKTYEDGWMMLFGDGLKKFVESK